MHEAVSEALSKAAAWLAGKQKKDGSWPRDRHLFSEPEVYLAELVVTSECAQALLLAGESRYFRSIQRALNFCADYPLEKGDPTAWYAWKLMALRLSNSESNIRQASILARALAKRQDSQGFWPAFPTTLNTTNCMAVDALIGMKAEALERAAKWFRKSRAKDDKGWGHDARAKHSETPSTAYISTALILCEESPDSPILQKARTFLEKMQRADGSWIAQRVKIPSTYATSRAALALMMLSKSPFNSNVVNALKFLLKSQSRTGGWAFAAGKPPQFYTTYYSVLTLALWRYLKEFWDRSDIKQLRDQLGPQETAIWLYRRFPYHLQQRYEKMLLRSMLNTKALGSTKDAIKRRQDILCMLSRWGSADSAEVIDRLKMRPEYSGLSKKSHITQIKADLDYLAEINLVSRVRGRYALIRDLLES